MSFLVRDGQLDLIIAAGPGVRVFPSHGVKWLSRLCSRAGLRVGVYGSDGAWVRGLVPAFEETFGSGYEVLIEDSQGRVHRIFARALVRVSPPPEFPDPFLGWDLPGLIPLSSAEKMLGNLGSHQVHAFGTNVIVLGTGNKALRFASHLLENSYSKEVYCVETRAGVSKIHAWDVEKRRFESLGGRILFGSPLSLNEKSPQVWQLKLSDHQGTRLLICSRVVSAGPFGESHLVCEYPSGSGLLELLQVAPADQKQDVEGWFLEKEAASIAAGKILKRLGKPNSSEASLIEQEIRRSRAKLRRVAAYREPASGWDSSASDLDKYQGKWLAAESKNLLLKFSGLPTSAMQKRPIAAIECLEEIHCQVCADACPERAIFLGRVPRSKLNHGKVLEEDRCTGCGLCVVACPSRAITLVHEPENQPVVNVTMAALPIHRHTEIPGARAKFMQLLNRKGEALGTGRAKTVANRPAELATALLTLEIPAHLIHEVRQARPLQKDAAIDDEFISYLGRADLEGSKVDVNLNGARRRVRPDVPLTVALTEVGAQRSEDSLFCNDGSCGLCYVTVDGIRKLACQTTVHRGMSVLTRTKGVQTQFGFADGRDVEICPCLGISVGELEEQVLSGKMQSPERLLMSTGVGSGRCHGQKCMGAMKRLISRVMQGAEPVQATLEESRPGAQSILSRGEWIDWRSPWQDWIIKPNRYSEESARS